MLPTGYKTVYRLSVVIIVLAFIAAAGGFFGTHLYRDNALIKAAWQGNDLVTLLVVIPVMIMSLLFARRGSQRAHWLWMGSLGYMLYNYMFYLYGAAFNTFFLLYVALFSLSIQALVLALTKANVNNLKTAFLPAASVKWVAAFILVFATGWGGMEISRALSFLFTHQVPPDITATGHPTGVVYATDLSLLIPAMLLAGTLLWKRRPWGFAISLIILFKGCAYGLALIAMAAFAATATGKWDAFTPVYIFLSTGSLVALLYLLRQLKPVNRKKIPMPIQIADSITT